MGGRWRGVLPRALRFAAVFQAFTLLGLVAVVLAHAGLIISLGHRISCVKGSDCLYEPLSPLKGV